MIKNNMLTNNKVAIEKLRNLQEKPQPYAPGEPLFWNDPHISQQMLAAHLNPNLDAASRRPETIVRTVNWIIRELALPYGAAVLDLGCGPGLYSLRFAEKGFQVTGVDYSERSVEYAKQAAADHKLDISYRFQDYLTLKDASLYEAALLIYGDFCPLSPAQRGTLLANIYRALKPNGWFVLDVSRQDLTHPDRSSTSWYATNAGFWKPVPHLVLEQTISYLEQGLHLDQYSIVEADGTFSVYRNWRQEYTPESIAAELAAGGFEVQSFWGDLTGMPDTTDSEWIGIVAQKQ